MAHDAHAAAAERPHPHYKEYWVIIGILTALTVLEVGLAAESIRAALGPGLFVSGMVFLAIAKAGLVGLFFMHLKHETRVMRWTVIGPLTLPFIYAAILMAEALWRLHATQGIVTWMVNR